MVKAQPEGLDRDELRRAAPRPLDREKLLLGVGLLLPPIAWSLHLSLSYGLVYPAIDWQSKLPLYLVSVASALLSLTGAGLGLRALRRVSSAPVEQGVAAYTRFLASAACGMGAFFFLATLAQSVSALMLSLNGRP